MLLSLELAIGYEWVVLGSLGASGLPIPDGSAAAWTTWTLNLISPILADATVAALVATASFEIFSRRGASA